MEKILAQAAEAVILQDADKVIKRRISKGYRLKELDEKLRKSRTRSEAKIIEKLKDKISVPKIIKVNEKDKEITMDFISGKKLSDNLDDFDLKKQIEICTELGKEVGKIHDLGLIHGDLTTSNMILSDNKVYFIDFGLAFHSSRIEDMAVDLHLLRQALEAKHFSNWQKLFEAVLNGYSSKDKSKVLAQLEKVESRGRYKEH